MKGSRLPLILPILVAAYSVINLAAKNIDRLTAIEVFRPLGAAVVLAGVLLLLSLLIIRNRDRAGLYASLLLTLTLSFVGVRGILRKVIPSLNTHDVYQTAASMAALAFTAFVAVLVLVLIRRTKRDLRPLARYLALLTSVLLVFPLLSIARYAAVGSKVQDGVRLWDRQVARECRSMRAAASPTPAPDIYYIVLDMYARPDVQKKHFGYDDSAFAEYLEQKGFYVAKNSHCNYPFTLWSLASSLNSDYLRNVDQYGSMDSIHEMLRHMIRNNRISQHLQQAGYKYVLLNSGWEVSAGGKADVVLPRNAVSVTEMERVLIKKSVFDVWWRDSIPYLRPYVMNCFDEMAGVPQIDGPTFTFAHFVCPHEPWIFDKNGDEPTNPATAENADSWKKNYTDQVDYVNQRVERLVDAILAHSKTPPIIIIQGDHGAYEPEFYANKWTSPAAKLTDEEVGVGFTPRTRILNAYYFPGKARKALYPTITPVNSFRILLNEYFGYHLKLLPDTTYIPKAGESRNEAMSPKDMRVFTP